MEMEKNFYDLVCFATLAPSSHNTQCWKFQIHDEYDNIISILPDFTRRCPVVDPDDHHLYVSLGCAVENMVITAKAHGLHAEVDSSSPARGIHVTLSPTSSSVSKESKANSKLFQAIPKRQCTRNEYDGNSLPQDQLDELRRSGQGDGVHVELLTNNDDMQTIQDYIIQANTAQMCNQSFKEELKSWVRFNGMEANSRGDGLFGKCMGAPSAPRWLGGVIFDYGVTASSENRKITKQIQSSAGVAVFVSDQDDPIHWVEVGRCYQRFALTATAMDVRNAFLNQPVEESSIRPAFMKALKLKEGSRRIDLVVRFGRGQEMPRSYRRPHHLVFSAYFLRLLAFENKIKMNSLVCSRRRQRS